jgi:hypothetical protein
MDRWKKQQKKLADEADEIDPFFNDIAGLSDDDDAVVEEETAAQKKKITPNKRAPTKRVNIFQSIETLIICFLM